MHTKYVSLGALRAVCNGTYAYVIADYVPTGGGLFGLKGRDWRLNYR